MLQQSEIPLLYGHSVLLLGARHPKRPSRISDSRDTDFAPARRRSSSDSPKRPWRHNLAQRVSSGKTHQPKTLSAVGATHLLGFQARLRRIRLSAELRTPPVEKILCLFHA